MTDEEDFVQFNPFQDQWQHPVQMFMSAEEIKSVHTNKYAQCRHRVGPASAYYFRQSKEHPFGTYEPLGTVTLQEFMIPMQPYLFDFEDTLGFTTMIYMNICSCGVLYVGRIIRRVLQWKDIVTGMSHYTYEESTWKEGGE